MDSQIPPQQNNNDLEPAIQSAVSKKPSPTFLIVIGAIVLLAVGLLSGYFLSNNIQHSSTTTQQPTSPTLTQVNNTNPTIDPTADWKTYTNTQYGYSFKYPEGTNVAENVEGNPGGTYTAAKLSYLGPTQTASGRTQTELFDGYMVSVTLSWVDATTPLEAATKAAASAKDNCPNSSAATISSVSSITIGGQKAATYSEKNCVGDYTISFIKTSGKIFAITETYNGGTPEIETAYQKITDQIVSTFQFTNQEQATGTTSSKTYTTDASSVQYPSSWYVYQSSPSCALLSDISNPQDIPAKISPTSHQLVSICDSTLAMPQSFPYTNGSSTNTTIKPFTISGYTGIRGNESSTIGLSDVVYLDNPGWGHVEIMLEAGDETTFNQILSTYKFNHKFSDGGQK